MLKRFLFILAVLALATGANAQNPQPATLTIDPTQTPEVLQVLDAAGQWAPMGNVDPTTHAFHPLGAEADILVTDPSVGMAPGAQDNSPFVQNLMNRIGPPSGASGYDVTFPGIPGQTYTTYHFTKPFVLSRGARYHCSGATGNYPSVVLAFDAGINGVIQSNSSWSSDGGTGAGTIDGCYFWSNGFTYNASMAGGSNQVTNAVMLPDPGNVLPLPVWGVGDGVVTTPLSGKYSPVGTPANPVGTHPVVPPGTKVTGIAGTTLTLSNPANFQFGAAQGQFNEVTPLSPLTNFGDGDVFVVGNNTYTARKTLGSTPGNFLIGASWNATALNWANCINSNVTNTTCVASTTAPNVTAIPPLIGDYWVSFWALNGGTAGNSLPCTYTPAGTSAGSCSAATFGSGSGMTPGVNSKAVGLFQLPAAQAYTVNTTSGLATVTVTAGPTADPNRLVRPGSYVWTPAFPYLTSVQGANTTAGGQTLTLTKNASATDVGDSLWILPQGLKRETAAKSSNNTFNAWAFGLNMTCSTAFSFNCTASEDQRNTYIADNLVGRMVSGNNTGASGSINEVGGKNFIADVIEAGSVGSAYFNLNSNSFEGGNSPYGVIGYCAAANTSAFFGGYWSQTGYNYCTGTNFIPTVPSTSGQTLVFGPQTQVMPAGTSLITGGSFYGPWKFLSGPTNLNCFQFSNATTLAVFAFSNNGCTNNLWSMNWNGTTNDWGLGYSATTSAALKFFSVPGGYTGYGAGGNGLAAPQGILLSGWPNQNTPTTWRLFGATTQTPAENWHGWGDTYINTVAPVGGQLFWNYAPAFSTTLTSAVVKGQPTSTPATVTLCPPTALPTSTVIFDTTISPPVSLGLQSSCTAGTLTFTAATLAAANSGDTIKFLRVYGAGPISNDPANPDYTATTIRSGSSANKDLTGRIALAGGTANYTLTPGAYASAPDCLCADTTTPANLCSVSESTIALTFTGTGTDTVKWLCDGRN